MERTGQRLHGAAMMRLSTAGLLLYLLFPAMLWGVGGEAAGQVVSEDLLPGTGAGHSIVTLQTRPGVTLGLLLIQPARPQAGVVLFMGGGRGRSVSGQRGWRTEAVYWPRAGRPWRGQG